MCHAQESVTSDVKAFVTNFWSEWSQPNTLALPYVTNAVSDPINFYGKPTSRADFATIQNAFAVRWPIRSYSLVPGTLVIRCGPVGVSCDASGTVNWIDSSPGRDATSTGTAVFSLALELPALNAGSNILITAETGHVISRTISPYRPNVVNNSSANLPSAAPSAAPANPAPVPEQPSSPAPQPSAEAPAPGKSAPTGNPSPTVLSVNDFILDRQDLIGKTVTVAGYPTCLNGDDCSLYGQDIQNSVSFAYNLPRSDVAILITCDLFNHQCPAQITGIVTIGDLGEVSILASQIEWLSNQNQN